MSRERTREEARRLRRRGMGITAIGRVLEVPYTTVRRWVDPDYVERERQRHAQRRLGEPAGGDREEAPFYRFQRDAA